MDSQKGGSFLHHGAGSDAGQENMQRLTLLLGNNPSSTAGSTHRGCQSPDSGNRQWHLTQGTDRLTPAATSSRATVTTSRISHWQSPESCTAGQEHAPRTDSEMAPALLDKQTYMESRLYIRGFISGRKRTSPLRELWKNQILAVATSFPAPGQQNHQHGPPWHKDLWAQNHQN